MSLLGAVRRTPGSFPDELRHPRSPSRSLSGGQGQAPQRTAGATSSRVLCPTPCENLKTSGPRPACHSIPCRRLSQLGTAEPADDKHYSFPEQVIHRVTRINGTETRTVPRAMAAVCRTRLRHLPGTHQHLVIASPGLILPCQGPPAAAKRHLSCPPVIHQAPSPCNLIRG